MILLHAAETRVILLEKDFVKVTCALDLGDDGAEGRVAEIKRNRAIFKRGMP